MALRSDQTCSRGLRSRTGDKLGHESIRLCPHGLWDHQAGGLNNTQLLLTAREAGSPGSRCQQTWCLVKACFGACTWGSFHCVLTWRKESFLGSLYEGTNHLSELPSPKP